MSPDIQGSQPKSEITFYYNAVNRCFFRSSYCEPANTWIWWKLDW